MTPADVQAIKSALSTSHLSQLLLVWLAVIASAAIFVFIIRPWYRRKRNRLLPAAKAPEKLVD